MIAICLHYNFLSDLTILDFLGVVTISATPNRITTIATMVIVVIDSLRIAHPRITAITGLTYANVLAREGVVTLRSQ
jgi:Na+-transporting NADH:ubiquinone oxidoreductase subunit NqrE